MGPDHDQFQTLQVEDLVPVGGEVDFVVDNIAIDVCYIPVLRTLDVVDAVFVLVVVVNCTGVVLGSHAGPVDVVGGPWIGSCRHPHRWVSWVDSEASPNVRTDYFHIHYKVQPLL